MGRQTVVETPSEENGLLRLVDVRKSSPVERHPRGVPRHGRILTDDQPAGGSAADQGFRPTKHVNPSSFLAQAHAVHPLPVQHDPVDGPQVAYILSRIGGNQQQVGKLAGFDRAQSIKLP